MQALPGQGLSTSVFSAMGLDNVSSVTSHATSPIMGFKAAPASPSLEGVMIPSSVTIDVDETGNVISYDSSAEDLFGLEHNDVEGRHISRLVLPSSQDVLDTALLQFRKNPTAAVTGAEPVQIRRVRGEPMSVNITISSDPSSHHFCSVRFATTPVKPPRSGLALSLAVYEQQTPLGLPPRPQRRASPHSASVDPLSPSILSTSAGSRVHSSHTFNGVQLASSMPNMSFIPGSARRAHRLSSDSSDDISRSIPSQFSDALSPVGSPTSNPSYYYPHRFPEIAGPRSAARYACVCMLNEY